MQMLFSTYTLFFLAREERLELPTPGFGDQCSTKLSYSRKLRLPTSQKSRALIFLSVSRLVKHLSNLTRTYSTTTFTDCETKTYVKSNRIDELYRDFYVIARHYHFSSLRKSNFTGAVHCTKIELRTILVTERSMTTAFFFLQYVDRSLEF